MAEGRVKWFSEKKGYGFIAAEGGRKFFVHYASIQGFACLQEGDRVNFEEEEGGRAGKAIRVKKL